jgi:hypothetical protein
MNFGFTNAALAGLLALAILPPLIHLVAHRRPQNYTFPPAIFLRNVVRHAVRARRPREWLLLALRTLLFLALILLILKPLYYPQAAEAAPGQRRNVVVVVDASASMAWNEGAQTRFAAACAEAAQILSDLRSGDLANVVWMRAEPETAFPDLSPNHGQLRDLLRRAQVTSETGDAPAALRLAARQLEGHDGTAEICVVSDFQTTNWNPFPSVPGTVRVLRVPVGREEAANLAVTRIECDPPRALAGEEVRVLAEVANFSPQARKTSVSIEAGETRQTREVPIPAWGRATATFRWTPARSGITPIHARIGEDGFGGDDRRWHLIEIEERIRVALDTAHPDTSDAWRRAFDALGWVSVEPLAALTATDGTPPPAAVFLSAWDGSEIPGLAAAARNGTAVVFRPADQLDFAKLRGTGLPGVGEFAGTARAETGGPFRVGVSDPNHPLFRIFAQGEHGDPSRAMFRERLLLPPLPGMKPLLAYPDGVPALALAGERLVLWNLALDRSRSGWTAQPEFVMFLGELILRLRAPPRAGNDASLFPGMPVTRALQNELEQFDLKLAGPDGSPLAFNLRPGPAGTIAVGPNARTPGIHTWSHRGTPIAFAAVQFPASESDLRTTIETPAAGDARSGRVADGRSVDALRNGIPLWPWMLAAAVALLILETLALAWAERPVRWTSNGETP